MENPGSLQCSSGGDTRPLRDGYFALSECAICGAPRELLQPTFANVPDEEGNGVFTILACTRCGHGGTDPSPTDDTIRMLYSGANPDYELAGRSLPDRLKDLFAEQVVRSAHREMGLAIRSVLDYGTGGGRYAAAAARSSPSATVTGTDFAPTPPAGSYFGSHGRLQYIPYDKLDNSTRFDLVIARHVLEHVHDPIALLRDLLARTTPAGAVYIEVPNLRSRTAALVGVKWPLFFVPRHVSHFTRSSLSAAITRAGGVGPVKRAEMPLMSNVLAISLGAIRYDDRFKIPGMLLHPVQLAIESLASEGTCLRAVVRRA